MIAVTFQALPNIGRKVQKLEEEAASLDASGEVIAFIYITLVAVKMKKIKEQMDYDVWYKP